MSWVRILAFAFLIFSGPVLLAQVSFNTRVSAKHIGSADVLELSFEIVNGNLESFSHPTFAEWRQVGGPNQSSSTLVSNGQTTTSISYSFYLEPTKPGVFIIEGAKAVINGKTLTSNPVQIKVDKKEHLLSADSHSASSNSGSLFDALLPPEPQQETTQYDGFILKAGEDPKAKTKENLFFMVSVSKKSCYLGEVVVAEYSLYTRVNMQANITKRPSFNGFSSIDLGDSSLGEFVNLEYKGKQFRVYTVRKVQLYALQAGKQTLSPVEIEAKVEYRKVPTTDKLQQYDPYSPDNVLVLPYTVVSEPIIIDVLPLPTANQPAGFTGATGRFEVKTRLTKNELALKQAGTVEVEINGQGNWAMVQPPNIKWPAGFEVFEPTSFENIDSQAIPLAGKRIYRYSFTSSDSGTFTFPTVEFSYFDPWKKSFQTSKSDSIPITILNKTLSIDENSYLASNPVSTDIFLRIVKLVFPILAIGLIIWLWMANRRRKHLKQNQQVWEAYNQSVAAPNKVPEPIINNNLLAKPEEKWENIETDYQKYQPAFSKTSSKVFTEQSKKPDLLETAHLPTLPINPINTETFFAKARKDLESLLRKHWQIEMVSTETLTSQLVVKGMLAEDAESVKLLWEASNRHLYSPLSNSQEVVQWHSIFEEIKLVLTNKNDKPNL